MIVLIIKEFPVPPQPMTVAPNGLYFVSLFKNFTIMSINASTAACCCSDRLLSEYSDPFFCVGI
jgi:hypothetical protein